MGVCVEGSAALHVQTCWFSDACEFPMHVYDCADIAVVGSEVESRPVGVMASGVPSALLETFTFCCVHEQWR